MNFEQNLVRLEEIVKTMERGEISLEESLKQFEEGVKLTRACQTQLSEAETTIQRLLSVDDAGKAKLEEFKISE